MTFALSEIFVTAYNVGVLLNQTQKAPAYYYDTLSQGAFGNFRDLLYHVGMHPCMGSRGRLAGLIPPPPVKSPRLRSRLSS